MIDALAIVALVGCVYVVLAALVFVLDAAILPQEAAYIVLTNCDLSDIPDDWIPTAEQWEGIRRYAQRTRGDCITPPLTTSGAFPLPDQPSA